MHGCSANAEDQVMILCHASTKSLRLATREVGSRQIRAKLNMTLVALDKVLSIGAVWVRFLFYEALTRSGFLVLRQALSFSPISKLKIR